MFSRPIAIESGECVTRDGFIFTDILPKQSFPSQSFTGEAAPTCGSS
jgi:hypothetical protein